MRLSDFDFDLPEALIATRPARPRTSARLLHAEAGGTADRRVSDLPRLLRPGDLLVLNDTRVLPARLGGVRHRASPDGSGAARIEATLTEPRPDGTWAALLKPLRKVKIGENIIFSNDLSAVLEAKSEAAAVLRFNLTGAEFDAALARAGAMPLPPYIARRRAPDDRDREDYQTVFARTPGAVAAPTASLHFDAALLAELEASGISFAHVTLHVGAGTFLPVTVDDIRHHKMHAERGQVTPRAAETINAARAGGRRVIAVGTTALRLIESAASGGVVQAFDGATDIFIRPGYAFQVTDGLMTNFHLPRSTLMMLVSALMGASRIRQIYGHAISRHYRFYSYGDSSLLIP